MKEQNQLEKYLKKLVNENSFFALIKKGLILGLFTAFGATIGFSIIIFLFAGILSQVRTIPFLDEVLRSTKLDILIERELKKINQDSVEENSIDRITFLTSVKVNEFDREIRNYIIEKNFIKVFNQDGISTTKVVEEAFFENLINLYTLLDKNKKIFLLQTQELFLNQVNFFVNNEMKDNYSWNDYRLVEVENPNLYLLIKKIIERVEKL